MGVSKFNAIKSFLFVNKIRYIDRYLSYRISCIYYIYIDNKNANLAAFSVYTNGGKIFKCNRNKSINVMDCLNGIRVLSILWVVYGHTYFTQKKIPMMNSLVLADWVEKESSMIVLGATVSVDSFFLLSGLLVAWTMLKHLDVK